MKEDPGFAHRFIPASEARAAPLLLVLHGTGGDENDLIPLGRELLPGAARLSVRGKVLENGMRRFFRRFAEGVFDVEDLKFRTEELAEFVNAAAARYGFQNTGTVAVGYSNGANIASSLMFLHPHLLSGAVLFRGMVPFPLDSVPDLRGVPVLLASGNRDPVVPKEQVSRLAAMFEGAGADVSIHWHPGGHELGSDDVEAARMWMASRSFRPGLHSATNEAAGAGGGIPMP